MDSPTVLLIALLLCFGLAAFSYVKHILDAKGSLASLVVGLTLILFGGLGYLLALLGFLVANYVITRFGFQKKRVLGVEEGKKGERKLGNVIANGAIPVFVVVVAGLFPGDIPTHMAVFLYVTAISVASSDTFASEIGVLFPGRVVLITDWSREVRPGVDGGISLPGTMAALLGALIASIIGWTALTLFPFPVSSFDPLLFTSSVVLGFLGCQVDSFIGATLEIKGWVHKGGVNILSIGSVVFLAGLLLLI